VTDTGKPKLALVKIGKKGEEGANHVGVKRFLFSVTTLLSPLRRKKITVHLFSNKKWGLLREA
jgi:hypothetical protein